MPRLQNKATGVIVNVDDATAAELGAHWANPAAAAAEPKQTPAPKRTASK